MSVSGIFHPSMNAGAGGAEVRILERLFKPGSIGSPQQIQIRDIISYYAKKTDYETRLAM